jgi:hypothetical protein
MEEIKLKEEKKRALLNLDVAMRWFMTISKNRGGKG